MPTFQTFHVTSAGESLASALRRFLPDQSWSQIRRLVQGRRVQVDGNLCLDDARKVKDGDVIRVSDHPFTRPIDETDVVIVHHDEQLVVIDKPAGVTTLRHGDQREMSDRRKQLQPTLDEWIERKLFGPHEDSAKRRPKQPTSRVRPVHRLDRDTSGLMVFALTPEAETQLIRQFKKHTIERAYLAIVHGTVTEQTIETQLVRDRGDGLRGSTSDEKADDAERAVTHVRPLETLAGYTVVECRLETGRTHQIRIHLSELGHMLCGEKTYVRDLAGRITSDASGATRQALHAAALGFVHPFTKLPVQFVSPPPEDFMRLLERLRKGKK